MTKLAFSVNVTDAEDTVDCDDVVVSYVLGHDTHGHPPRHRKRL